jgi:hypothetical protein
MISKKAFVDIMNEYKSLREDEISMYNVMRKLDPDFGGFGLTRHAVLIDKLLRLLMEDEPCDWIGYFNYELECGKIDGKVTLDKKKIKLRTFEDLYNLLTKERK